MRRCCAFFSVLAFPLFLSGLGCGGGGGFDFQFNWANGPAPPAPRVPYIKAELTSFPVGSVPASFGSNARVAVLDDIQGSPITDATVSMNGLTLAYQLSDTQSFVPYREYAGHVVVAPGGVVTLKVMVDGRTYTVSATQHASYPTLSSPASGGTWAADASNTAMWSGGTSTPSDSCVVGLLDPTYPRVPWSYEWMGGQALPAGTTSCAFPPYSLAGGNRYVLAGIQTKVAIPGAVADSSLTLGGFGCVPVTISGMPVTSRLSGDETTPYLWGATWSGALFTVVGSDGTILTSPDGAAWTLRAQSPLFTTGVDLRDVIWTGTQFVAVAGDSIGSIRTSPDGLNWTLLPLNPPPLYGIAWSGTRFVAVGENTILTSSDGITWTPQSSGQVLNSVVWSGTQFIAVGAAGVILTSPDGTTWTARSSGTTDGLLDLASSGSQLVAVGGNATTGSATILTSTDGVTWTLLASPTSTIANDGLKGVTWAGTQFVAVGANGIIFTSPDGATWTQQASGRTRTLYGLAWSGTSLVMTGQQDTILTSP